MASISTWPAGRSFTFSLFKQLTTNPAVKWNNTYELFSISDGTLANIITAGRLLVGFERYLHPTRTFFTTWEARTGAHDSRPYNPTAFYSEPIEQPGQWDRGTPDYLDQDVCLWADRAVQLGRLGRLFFRSVLTEDDVSGAAGKFALGATAAVIGRFATAVSANLPPLLVGALQTGPLILCLIGPNGEYPRGIFDLFIHGVSIAKRNHKYFDRPPAAGPAPVYVYEDLIEDVDLGEVDPRPSYDPDPIPDP